MPSPWQYIPNQTIEDEERDKAATRWQQAQRAQLASEWADRQRAKLQQEMQELSRQTMPVGRARLEEEIGRAGMQKQVPQEDTPSQAPPTEPIGSEQVRGLGAGLGNLSSGLKSNLPGYAGAGDVLGRVGQGAGDINEGLRSNVPGYSGAGDVVGKVGEGLQWWGENVAAPTAEVAHQVVRRPSGPVPGTIAQALIEGVIGAGGPGQYVERLKAERAARPEAFVGEKFAEEVIADPANFIGLGTAKGIVQGARGLAPVAKAGLRAAEDVITDPRVQGGMRRLVPGATVEDVSKGGQHPWVTAAKAEFGTTWNPREAGYIAPDGTFLDFSGKRQGGEPNSRSFDHRDIWQAMPENEGGGSEGMIKFMTETGSIRWSNISDSVIIDVTRKPTPAQMNTLLEWADGQDVNIDITGGLSGRVLRTIEMDNVKPVRLKAQLNKAFQDLGGDEVVRISSPPEAGGAVIGAAASYDPEAELDENARRMLLGAGAGFALGKGLRPAAEAIVSRGKKGPFTDKLGSVADMLNSPNPTIRTLGKMYADQPAANPLGTVGQRFESARRAVVRASTDNMVDLAQFQKAAERAKGAPLSPDEMVTELRRLNTDKAAEVRLQEGLQPAFQSVGDDRTALSVYLTLQDNIDVANAMGQKVERDALKADLPGMAASDLSREQARLRALQLQRTAYTNVPDKLQEVDERIAASKKAVVALQRKIKRQEAARASGAVQAGSKAQAQRQFSGDVSLADSQQALTDMAGQLGAARIDTIEQAAQQVWDFNRTLLQRKKDAGLITEALFNDLTSKYPHYVPTRITDYLKDPLTVPRGKSLSVRDTGLRRNTVEGTTRAREDPLASAVRNAYDTETLVRRNDAFNAFVKIKDYDPQYAALIRSVPDSYTATRNEVKVSGFVNGKRETFAMPKEFETLIKAEPGAVIPGAPGAILRGAMGLFRAVTTGRNPLFLAGNAFLDAANYTIRESSRAGGPQNLPKVLNELGKAYADSFQGLFQGAYRGDTADFLRGGGGMFGFFQGTPGEARATVEGLSRRNVFEVNGKADIGRLVKDLATLKPVESVGERIELAPRVASFNLARDRGANNVKAVINGRTVTIDFAQGGDVAKVINQFVPFFNVGMQAGAQMVRGARENPKAYIASALALVGAPTLVAEAWNRSDPQRAKDYQDVPQYIKDQGVVIMLPGEASVDARGNRRPQFVHIRLREFAPIAIVTREAASRALGDDPREWTELVAESLVSVSPIQGNNAADAISSFVPLGVSTGLQLASNKDYFRNRMIATKGGNERASEVAKVIAGAVGAQPSQVDFAIGDLGGGVGKIAVAAGQAATGKMQPSGTASDVPVIGGAIGRFVRSDIGGRLQKAQQQTMSGADREALKTAGVDLVVGPVGSTIDNVSLKLAEEEQYQVLTNQYVQQDIDSLLKHPVWQQLSPEQRTKLVQDAVAGARDKAGAKVLQTMGNAEIKRRLLKP